MKDLNGGSSSVLEPKPNVGGGVEDVYGEDQATEDQLVTPWVFSVSRYVLYVACPSFRNIDL